MPVVDECDGHLLGHPVERGGLRVHVMDLDLARARRSTPSVGRFMQSPASIALESACAVLVNGVHPMFVSRSVRA